jgi:hypothetical protein
VLPALSAARHVPFDRQTRCEAAIGGPLTPGPSPASGAIESLTSYAILPDKQRTGLELSGWATRDGTPAECIAIVDSTGTVIGAGAIAGNRLDPATGRKLPGWKAVAPETERFPLCAYALFPGSADWVPLDGCRTAP